MKKVLILGAGLVSRPVVRYLLDRTDFGVTVADQSLPAAEGLVAGHPRGVATTVLANDATALGQLVADHDLVISLLPAALHPDVAALCVEHRKHLVTASYVSPKMRELDEAARRAGVLLLNEIGLDPGIDHMTAMRVIDDVRQKGGTVVGFTSYCGGIPAPEARNNPFAYKFSWSPIGVLNAAKSPAKFLLDGQMMEVAAGKVFDHARPFRTDGVETLEGFPNRDSLGYLELYGLNGVKTMYRGTLRVPRWSAIMKAIYELGLLSDVPMPLPIGMTLRQFLAAVLKCDAGDDLRQVITDRDGMAVLAPMLSTLNWLGLFSDDPLPWKRSSAAPIEIMADLMAGKMQYAPGERDMVVLHHRFDVRGSDGAMRQINSTLLDYGVRGGDTAMARLVGLPVACASHLVLTGRVSQAGVHIPVTKEFYGPVLQELQSLGVECHETHTAKP